MVADSWIFDEEDRTREANNLTQNIIRVIEAHPNVKFRLIIPPSSIARWCEYYELGEVQYRIDSLEYALFILVQYENVEVYGFDDAFEITMDLNNYSDTIHYEKRVNEYILNSISEDKSVINRERITTFIDCIRKNYAEYNYSGLNVYIE